MQIASVSHGAGPGDPAGLSESWDWTTDPGAGSGRCPDRVLDRIGFRWEPKNAPASDALTERNTGMWRRLTETVSALAQGIGSPDRWWARVSDAVTGSDTLEGARQVHDAAVRQAPVVWLLGKTGAGKTSVIAALTGESRAEIGSGVMPCTRASQMYDWPAEAPVLRFLDTRGLGEAGYDPAEDIAVARAQAHVLLVVAKVNDPKQTSVLETLAAVRRADRTWPVIVVQTGLHLLYEGRADHPAPYAYDAGMPDPGQIPAGLMQALEDQRTLFSALPGKAPLFVPVDFTQADDGYTDQYYGLAALHDALQGAGIDQWVRQDRASAADASAAVAAAAVPLIRGYMAAAAVAGAMPVPYVGTGGVAGTVALMLRALAARYDEPWTPGRLRDFGAAVGGATLLGLGAGYGAREAAKLIPVAGTSVAGALNALAAGALVYALGKAACVYLGARRDGRMVDEQAIRTAFRAAYDEARRLGAR